jgi:ubiquinone/menaquinone biosynthesis C-methylase UbiE
MLPTSVETAVYGVLATPALHLAITYGMVDSLLLDGPADSSMLAERLGLDADATERILLTLTAFQIMLRKPDGTFAVRTEAAPFLDPRSTAHIGGFVNHLMTETIPRLASFDGLIVQGKEAFESGLPTAYQIFYRDENSTREFMQAMWDLSYGASQELAGLAEVHAHRRLIDVGGANGPFAVAALQHAPDLHAVVFDLPQVRPHLERARDEHGLRDRLAFVAGDFFSDDFPEGDLISLGYVMSNWPDEECQQILRKSYRACAPGGRVVIMDRLFDEEKNGPVATAVMNMVMLLETRGGHRTPAEFAALLTAAGFQNPVIRHGGGDKHLVIAEKL